MILDNSAEKVLDEATYQNDIFLAYSEPHTVEAAKKLAQDLRKMFRDLQVFCYGEHTSTGNFKYTSSVAQYGAKSFLLLLSEDMIDEKTGKIPLWKIDEATGKRVPRGMLTEIVGACKNQFMSKRMFRPDESPYQILFFRNPGSERKISANTIFDLEEIKEAGGSNPFDGTNVFYFDPEKDTLLETIGNWALSLAKTCVPEEKEVSDIYWVGTRLSDIAHCDKGTFVGSICLFGKNDPEHGHYTYCDTKRRIDHNAMNEDADMWVFNTVKEVLKKNPKAHFYCYNPIIVYSTKGDPYSQLIEGTEETYLQRFICLNQRQVVIDMNNKEKFREAFEDGGKGKVRFLKSVLLRKSDCKYNILMDRLAGEYPEGSEPRFVIQAPISSGGASTYIMDSDHINNRNLLRCLDNATTYICTVYKERNIPVNLHAIIFDGKDNNGVPHILFSAPSIQLVRECEGRLIYRGADFVEARNIPQDLLDEFYRQARVVCNELHARGYRGVCGIDAILTGAKEKRNADFDPFDHVFLMEINTRFQASSGLLNRALQERSCKDKSASWPTLQSLNRMACSMKFGSLRPSIRALFENGGPGKINNGNAFSNLVVPFSNFAYLNNNTTRQAMHLLSLRNDENVYKNNDIVEYELDELDPSISYEALQNGDYEPDAHLYRIVFRTNVTWINYESRLYFNENLLDENEDNCSFILGEFGGKDSQRQRMIRTKVALLIQGVVFDDEVKLALGDRVREGTFNSIDIGFDDRGEPGKFDGYVVNAPIVDPHNYDEIGSGRGVKFTGLTPFEIKKDPEDETRLILTYYGQYIDHIFLFPIDELTKESVNNIPYQDIAYLSTDRLRVHLTNACKYKRNDKGCKFCGITCGKKDHLKDDATFAQGNVQTVVERYATFYGDKWVESGGYKYYPALRHYLVGGQTMGLDEVNTDPRLIETVREISAATHRTAEIYAMIIPCQPSTVQAMQDVGLTHIAFNLEIWDDEIALDVMPGKRGENSREQYMTKLGQARDVMRGHESVRSMLMVGLEPMENTLEAIDALLAIDVQPMLSIFRPMPNTGPFADYMSPQITDVIDLFEKAEAKCKAKKYEYDPDRVMHLGPDCTPCQNNTVALPYEHDHN